MRDYSQRARPGRRPIRNPSESTITIALALLPGLALTLACSLMGTPTAYAETGAATAATLEIATLHLEITNLESDAGVLVAVLLDSAQQYDTGDQFFRSEENVPIRDGKASIRFEEVPYGIYAVKVFHDENSNGKLDTNFVGFPTEGFGFSNDAMGKFGPPSFEQAAFGIESKKILISITAN